MSMSSARAEAAARDEHELREQSTNASSASSASVCMCMMSMNTSSMITNLKMSQPSAARCGGKILSRGADDGAADAERMDGDEDGRIEQICERESKGASP